MDDTVGGKMRQKRNGVKMRRRDVKGDRDCEKLAFVLLYFLWRLKKVLSFRKKFANFGEI